MGLVHAERQRLENAWFVTSCSLVSSAGGLFSLSSASPSPLLKLPCLKRRIWFFRPQTELLSSFPSPPQASCSPRTLSPQSSQSGLIAPLFSPTLCLDNSYSLNSSLCTYIRSQARAIPWPVSTFPVPIGSISHQGDCIGLFSGILASYPFPVHILFRTQVGSYHSPLQKSSMAPVSYLQKYSPKSVVLER